MSTSPYIYTIQLCIRPDDFGRVIVSTPLPKLTVKADSLPEALEIAQQMYPLEKQSPLTYSITGVSN